MDVRFTLKNYRCFTDIAPARFTLRDGFTAFVGPNNSGKSSLLRFLYEFRPLFTHFRAASDLLNAIQGNYVRFNLSPSVVDPDEVFANSNSRDLYVQMDFSTERTGAPPSVSRVILQVKRGKASFTCICYVDGTQIDLSGRSGLKLGAEGVVIDQDGAIVTLAPLFKVRDVLTQTIYIGSFRNILNIGTQNPYFDISVGQAFVQQWRQFKTGPRKYHNERIYRLTEDIRKLFEFERLEINPTPDDSTLQLFVNGKSYRLGEVGAGLAQFVISLGNVALREPSLVLIDEPEASLHPSLQLDFLTTLGAYADRGVVFATHSLGLARASADRVYSTQMSGDGHAILSEFASTPRLAEFLGELGFAGYRELGFDTVLLVEGVTDVRVMQQFLRWFRLEHRIVVLPLGGAALINRDREPELHEIKRISETIVALIDSERSKAGESLETERQAFVDCCNRASVRCHVLERRSLENYFSDEAVRTIYGDKYRAPDLYEKIEDLEFGWPKAQNWRIARVMKRSDLAGTDLATFLDSLKGETSGALRRDVSPG